ncbi:MAG: septum formation initiator family protein [Microgenomates group bacterium]
MGQLETYGIIVKVKRNLLLIIGVFVAILLVVNSGKRIMSFKDTSKQVDVQKERLAELRRENEDLKRDLEYKKSQGFTEAEIRNKLGLAKEGETVVVLPGKGDETAADEQIVQKSNVEKWKELFFSP